MTAKIIVRFIGWCAKDMERQLLSKTRPSFWDYPLFFFRILLYTFAILLLLAFSGETKKKREAYAKGIS